MIYVGSQVIFKIHIIEKKLMILHIWEPTSDFFYSHEKKWYYAFVGPQIDSFIHIGEKKWLKNKKNTHTSPKKNLLNLKNSP